MIYLYENSEWEIAGTEKVVKFGSYILNYARIK